MEPVSQGTLEAAVGLRRRAEREICAKEREEALSVEESHELLHELRVHQIELDVQNEELRRGQVALDELRQQYFDLYELAPVGYVTVANTGEILEANLRFSKLLDLPRAELVGRLFTEFIVREDQDAFYLERKALWATGNRQCSTLRLKRAGGGMFWAQLEGNRDSGSEGEVQSYRLTATDVSEQRTMQESLAQKNRMESMGLLAAGVAHEINNPLTAVISGTEILAADVPVLAGSVGKLRDALARHIGEHGVRELLGTDEKRMDKATLTRLGELASITYLASSRIQDVARSLTSFSRTDSHELSRTDVNEVAREALAIVGVGLRTRAELVQRLERVPSVMAHPGRLCQALVNVLLNAAQAGRPGVCNRIRLRTWNDDNMVYLEVSDSGCGIEPSALAAVFEPFYTTKGAERGTGLGLSISRRLMTEMGGDLRLTSIVNQGTCATLEVPIPRQKVLPAAPSVEQNPTVHQEKGRLLLIDDDDMVRASLAAALRLDYEVVQANSGLAGREILEADQRFDLILCDVMMPAFSGIELHGWLAVQAPPSADRMVFITGGVFTPETRDYLACAPNEVLQKPFSFRVLRERLVEIRQQVSHPSVIS